MCGPSGAFKLFLHFLRSSRPVSAGAGALGGTPRRSFAVAVPPRWLRVPQSIPLLPASTARGCLLAPAAGGLEMWVSGAPALLGAVKQPLATQACAGL